MNKRYLLIGGSIFVLILIAILGPLRAEAGVFTDAMQSFVVGVVGTIIQQITRLLGWVFVKFSNILINSVAPYNDFVTAAPVEKGWVIARDISNMFFIMVLLSIAFGTMFGREDYMYQKRLPRLLIMAIFINFSRTITGIVIDAAQVIMLTFVNAFQAAGGGNLASGLGINTLLEIDPSATKVGETEALLGFLFAMALMAVATATIGILVLTLLYRVLMLWVLTITSPLAFLLSTFKRGEEYYKKWWDQLICWAFSGPILAFFLWLALATMVDAGTSVGEVRGTLTKTAAITRVEEAVSTGLVTIAANEPNIVRFAVGIMLLLAGIKAGQEFCGKALPGAGFFGKMPGMATGFLKRQTMKLGGKAVGGAWGAAKKLPSAPLELAKRFYPGKVAKGLGALVAVPYVGRAARGFAERQLAGLGAPAEKAFSEAATRATAAAARPDAALAMLRQKPRIRTPGNLAERAGWLKTALTDPRIFGALMEKGKKEGKSVEESQAAAQNQMGEWFNEYNGIQEGSASRQVVDGFTDIKKKNPHLIKDENEKKRMAGMLSGQAALDMNPAALKDAAVASSLTKGTKEFIEGRGSQVQKDNLATGLGATITDAGTDETKLRKINPETMAQNFDKLSPAQLGMALQIDQISIGSLTAEQLTANATQTEELARRASPEQLSSISKDPKLQKAFHDTLGSKKNDPSIAGTLFLSGMSFKDAFPNRAATDKIVSHPGARQILSRVSPATYDANKDLKQSVVQNVSISVLTDMAESGSKDEQALAAKIADDIMAAGGDRMSDVLAQPALRAIVKGTSKGPIIT